jgi:hypothetical protein
MTIRIKNWGKFQHYKNRRPPWIRLYRDLLDDPDFDELDGDLVKTLMKLWLAASDFSVDGTLPAIERLALRMHIASELLARQLIQLKQWLECDASELLAYCKQVAIPEGEQIRADQSQIQREREKPARARDQKRKCQLPADWSFKESHLKLASELRLSITDEVNKFREHAVATGRTMKNWDAAFNMWLRKASEYKAARPSKDKNETAMQSWERVITKAIRREPIELTDAEKRALRAIGGVEHLRNSKNLSVDCALFCRAYISLHGSAPPTPASALPSSKKRRELPPMTSDTAGPEEVRELLGGFIGYTPRGERGAS